jgi:hypothetical protein
MTPQYPAVSEKTMSDNLAAKQQQENTAVPLITEDELQRKVSQLVERALADETLRERLLREPTPLMRENEIEIPQGIEAHVTADGNLISVQFVPQKAGVEGELTEGELSNVAGGRKSGGGTSSGGMFLAFTFK